MPTNNIKEGYFTDYISGLPVKETPEELEAVQPFSKILVDDYGYPKEFIHTRPQYRVKARPSDRRKEYPVDIAFSTAPSTTRNPSILLLSAKRRIGKMDAISWRTIFVFPMLVSVCGSMVKSGYIFIK